MPRLLWRELSTSLMHLLAHILLEDPYSCTQRGQKRYTDFTIRLAQLNFRLVVFRTFLNADGILNIVK